MRASLEDAQALAPASQQAEACAPLDAGPVEAFAASGRVSAQVCWLPAERVQHDSAGPSADG